MSIKKLIKKLKEKQTPKFSYPENWEIKERDRFLILSPHPDDEIIACGGLMTLYAKQCDVICLTDGRYGDPEIEPDKMAEIRKNEFETVMKKTGINSSQWLGIEDSHLLENGATFKTINIKGYDYILMPSPFDAHPDHLAVDYLFRKYFKKYYKKVVYYELWSTLSTPTKYVDISSVIDIKLENIKLYKSQMKYIDYSTRIEGLNRYRGIIPHVEYAENYQTRC